MPSMGAKCCIAGGRGQDHSHGLAQCHVDKLEVEAASLAGHKETVGMS